MSKRYERNRIYLSPEDQRRIKSFRILLAGAGIGSNIAETLLRIGFETMTIIDGDVVEESNLNRQNYTTEDIGKPKVEALKERLLSINPKAQITAINTFINHDNVEELVYKHDVAVNGLDFHSDIPFVFDRICVKQGMHILHPYNVGFASVVMVISPESARLESLLQDGESCLGFEKRAVQHVTDYFNYWARPKMWIENIVQTYEKEGEKLPSPQLSIASSLAGGMCTAIIIRIARGEFVKVFPKFYYYSEHDDLN